VLVETVPPPPLATATKKKGPVKKKKAPPPPPQNQVLYSIPKKATKSKPSQQQGRTLQPSFRKVQKGDALVRTIPSSDLSQQHRHQLLLSGATKLLVRFFAGLYASAAAGSAQNCLNDLLDRDPNNNGEDDDTRFFGICLTAGYAYEAFVLGYYAWPEDGWMP
jgi:hypothetical protein